MLSSGSKLACAIVAAVLILIVFAASCRRFYNSNESEYHIKIGGTYHLVKTSHSHQERPPDLNQLESCNCKNESDALRESDALSGSAALSGTNTLMIYTGRWKFLRILFPYVYSELRKNGGVLDKVVYMMVAYDNETLQHLSELVKKANKVLKESVFEVDFLGYQPGTSPPNGTKYTLPYYQILSEIIKDSSKRFFKLDDDIIYIHPGTFRNMIESKDSDRCFLHYGNIVSNWRCNYKHQEIGVYDSKEVNPKKLKFEFKDHANCGWKSPECAELTLSTFLHYYQQQQLDKYLFNGIELLAKRRRFSINFFMLDKDLIDIKVMQEVGPIQADDEAWWSVKYAGKSKQPSCIVGGGLVVHFSYYSTYEKILQTGILSEFETIVQKEIGTQMDKELWRALNFSAFVDI